MRKLTQAETEALKTIAAECHEELRRGTPMKNAVKQCNKCKKRVNFTATCPLYPKRIPYEVLTGEGCPKFEAKEKQSTP